MQKLLTDTHAYKLLAGEIKQNRFSHAYLLQMDDKRNLRNTLKLFAKLFFSNMQESNRENVFRRIDEENFSDCLFFPDPDKKFMVDDAERLAEESLLNPVESDKKVFVVCDFADANAVSQNKLLKLLEEPPQNVVFLLGTTSAYSVLSTVLSRVEKLEIPPFSEKQICNALARIYPDGYTSRDFELCAAACGGSLGRAQDMLEGGEHKQLVEDAFALCLSTGATLPPIIKKIGETKRKTELLFLLRLIFRDGAVLKTGQSKEYLLLRSESERLLQMKEKYTLHALLFAQKRFSDAELHTAFNGVFSQCLEVTLSEILLQNAKDKRRQKS
jgi:DNA polymerase-3 subunit gamma/tau